MAVLTWRNVDAPQDRGNSAISGLTAAARLFDNGASGLGDAIGRFGTQQTDLANNAAVQAASRFQDSDQLKAALSDGSLFAGLQGVDPTRVDAKTTGLLNARVGDLLANTTSELNNQSTRQQMDVRGEKLMEDQYAFGRTKDQNALIDAARPAANALALASYNRDPAAIAAASADPSLARLPADVFQKLMTDATSQQQGRATLTGTDLSNQGTGLRNQATAFDNMVTQRNDRAQQGALAVMDQLKDAATGGEAYQQYNRIAQSLDPQVAATVRAQLEQRWGPIFGGAGSFPGSGGAGTGAAGAIAGAAGGLTPLGGAPLDGGDAGTAAGGKYNVTFGYRKTDVPITSMSIDDLTKKGGLQDQMINDPTLKNSPLGAYQINKDTLLDFAKRLGIKSDTKFTPEVQEQLGRAIFEDRKNGDLSKTWSSLAKIPGASDVGAFKNKSWDEVKDFIAQNEGTAKAETANDVRNEGKTLLDSLTNLKLNQGQKIQLNGANGIEKALAVTRSGDAGSEASNLIANMSAFKGADAGWLTDEINEVAKRGKLTAPQAATLIQQHLKSNQGTLANAADNIRTLGGLLDPRSTTASPNLPSGQRIDDRALLAAADSNAQGQGVAQLGQTQNMVASQAQIDQAGAALQAAQEQLINARQRALANPRWTGLKAVEQQYAQTVAQARLLLASAANNAPVNLVPGYNDQAARRAAASTR
ncbi:hypothetical protein [Caballeronia sp. TF1N1]|uniref:hypothetical protein n=1 Tax=Caballeronia sp. TF1N1 TaxID=2878153 RepID=UPI001FD2585A|nr:hypothetical protein [Caballeronia sp. TF1N1]